MCHTNSSDESAQQDFKKVTPKDALNLSASNKLLWFEKVRFLHPRLSEVLKNFEAMSERGSGTDIILLVGPTGVGKSTLKKYMWENLMSRLQHEMLTDPGFIPAVVFNGPASGESSFSWRTLYVRILEALGDPLIHRKHAVIVVNGCTLTQGSSHGTTVSALHHASIRGLIAHKTLLLMIDEAAPILRNRHGDSLKNAMDALRSLANVCGLSLVLIGSYDLLQLAILDGQLARRCSILDFPRYRKGAAEDEVIFKNMVCNLQDHLPLHEKPRLGQLSPELMDECLGCIGILKDTLSRALSLAIKNDGNWSNELLERALLPKASKKAILREILDGENNIRNAAFGSGKFNQLGDIEKSLREEGGVV